MKIRVRRTWLKIMGMSSDQIKESLLTDLPTDLKEEMKQLEAAIRLKIYFK